MELIVIGIAVLLAAVVALVVPMDRLAFVATWVFVLFVTWNGFRLGGAPVDEGGGGGSLSNAFMAVAILATGASVMIARRPIRVPPWILLAAGGFVLAAMLTLIFPPDSRWINQTLLSYRTDFSPPPQGLIGVQPDLLMLARLLLGIAVIPIVLTLVAPTVRRVKLLIDAFVISCTVNAAVGILDYAGLQLAPRGARAGREAGLTVHPNYFALTCTIGIPLALWWVSRGGRWRILGIGATALLLGGAYVAGGRAGAVAAPLALIITVAAIPNLRRALGYVLPVVGVLTVSVLLFTSTGAQVLEQLRFEGDPTTTGSDSARSHLASVALDQFAARPLQGVGIGVIQDAHSIYLQLLAAAGVIGLASFLTYIHGLANVVRRIRAGPQRDLATAGAIAVGVWLVTGIVSNQLVDKYLYIIPGLLLALWYATSGPQATPSRRSTAQPVRGAPAPPATPAPPEAEPPRPTVPARS